MEHAVRAYAKINITLDVVGKMPDGYHEMKMIMESVSLYDSIKIRTVRGQTISLNTNLPYLPIDSRNIAVKAAKLFLEKMGIRNQGLHIDILKSIPVCAGMAGGSSNAAAVLRCLNKMFDSKLKVSELQKMSEKLGSDVPYCVAGGTVLAQGRGEKLTVLKPMPRCPIVICKPNFSVSTPELFSMLDCDRIHYRPDTKGVIDSLENGDIEGIARRMYNVFEDVPHKGRKEITAIKSSMIDGGAIGAAMSGTGPTVFGLFEDKKRAEKTARYLRKSYVDVFLVNNIKRLDV